MESVCTKHQLKQCCHLITLLQKEMAYSALKALHQQLPLVRGSMDTTLLWVGIQYLYGVTISQMHGFPKACFATTQCRRDYIRLACITMPASEWKGSCGFQRLPMAGTCWIRTRLTRICRYYSIIPKVSVKLDTNRNCYAVRQLLICSWAGMRVHVRSTPLVVLLLFQNAVCYFCHRSWYALSPVYWLVPKSLVLHLLAIGQWILMEIPPPFTATSQKTNKDTLGVTW